MKLSKHLDLKSSMDIDGFVDLGQFTEEHDKHTRADHGLVLMYQPFFSVSIFLLPGVFASNGNVKAGLLTKIILEATLLCEQAGLHVDYICCDGAAWNRPCQEPQRWECVARTSGVPAVRGTSAAEQ
ncbi:hypothetical protein HPB47_025023 [Ixodes persulcatus]|uniref:Uncharacterized protein n=1 Tax=Ixodes persulcatus TaxID=34615 RepID=A0AC60Q501_IXOPE|nr:hypothetical protein HPB47_025023 [Ixodes persulcatus]